MYQKCTKNREKAVAITGRAEKSPRSHHGLAMATATSKVVQKIVEKKCKKWGEIKIGGDIRAVMGHDSWFGHCQNSSGLKNAPTMRQRQNRADT